MKTFIKDLALGIGYGIVFIMLCSVLDFAMNKI
ncbi:hypothetical protein F964_00514 [Acinetobacter guillouiae NIPH 991]|uniref:Uncharacterized protein n=1 Tax=Acinetobacter guillouiae NIPH 991 TaxID=1217656 RepID=N8YBL9_ACIGI|nr:hypothetical protein F964_00514 [Acinetobacter guillouiae NIPH 991]